MRTQIILMALLLILAGCASNTNLTVMTYNIHHGQGIDGKLDLNRIAGVIDQAKADLICLNEVDNNFGPRSNFVNQAKYLAESLEMHYVFGPALSLGSEENPNLYGNAILSRYPIKKTSNHDLVTPTGSETRACLAATVTIGKIEYTFLATHLDHRKTEVRVNQAQDIIAIISNIPPPVILAGDFNCPPPEASNSDRSKPAAIILDKLKSSFEIAGTGPADTVGSGRKIDYIFISTDLEKKVKNANVIRTPLTKVASDHLPMITEFEL